MKYKSVLSHVEIDLPSDPLRYTAVPNALPGEGVWAAGGVNEKNVAMTATETITSNERVAGADPYVEFREECGQPGGIGEEDLVTLVLPYIRSAGRAQSAWGACWSNTAPMRPTASPFRTWRKSGGWRVWRGHHWIAKKVPDDAYVVMPNQLGIDDFDLTDAWGRVRPTCVPRTWGTSSGKIIWPFWTEGASIPGRFSAAIPTPTTFTTRPGPGTWCAG